MESNEGLDIVLTANSLLHVGTECVHTLHIPNINDGTTQFCLIELNDTILMQVISQLQWHHIQSVL